MESKVPVTAPRHGKHSFLRSLTIESKIAAHMAWPAIYRGIFGPCMCMQVVQGSDMQRAGIDRVISRSRRERLRIQEKFRLSRRPYDVLIETGHVADSGRRWPGWIDMTEAEFLFMAWIKARYAILWDMGDFRGAWRIFGNVWTERYGVRLCQNTGYRSENVPIPISVFCDVAEPLKVATWPSEFGLDTEVFT